MNIITVGIDLAKNVFAVHGVDDSGKVDTLKNALKDTFEVHNLAYVLQCLVLIGGEFMTPPNLPDKSTTSKHPK